MPKIRRALISASDKAGIVDFARELASFGVEILSTGGTARLLGDAGIAVVEVASYTGHPEILDGRVKTLHPKIHGGLLALRDSDEHRRQMEENDIGLIDLVVVNLYPFEETIAKPDADLGLAIENIDIGGPTMLRSAAKNYAFVTVVIDPADYERVLDEMRSGDGGVTPATNRELAKKVFRSTARYDGAIADYLGSIQGDGPERAPFGETLHLGFEKIQDLRYGENPHQSAAFYAETRPGSPGEPSITRARQLQGKELSFNNIVDADAALELLKEFSEPAAIAIKHTNPCGAATGETLAEAFRRCRECDPVSIFGGIIGVNRELDPETAEELKDIFVEIVIAPSFHPDALEIYRSSKRLQNVRLLEVPLPDGYGRTGWDMKKVLGGLLVQDRDLAMTDFSRAKVVTKRAPTPEELRALEFAWKIGKHAKSNTIVFAREGQVVGVGAGQMSRVDSARIAVLRAETHGLDTRGTVVASDAFFPFRDGLDVCAQAGATAVAQPGGSMRDQDVIDAADEQGVAMVFTGTRHFRH